MSVMRDMSHDPIAPYVLSEQSPFGESFRHASTVLLSCSLDAGENIVHIVREIDPYEPANISLLVAFERLLLDQKRKIMRMTISGKSFLRFCILESNDVMRQNAGTWMSIQSLDSQDPILVACRAGSNSPGRSEVVLYPCVST